MADQDPMAAVSEGAAFVAALREQARKTAAYNALAKQYGDVAGDPDSALKMQSYGQHTQLDPITVEQAKAVLAHQGLENEGQKETNAYNVLNHPKLLQHQDLENTGQDLQNTQQAQTTKFDAQLQPGKVAQQGATLRQTNAETGLVGANTEQTRAQTAQTKFTTATAQGAQLRASAMGLIAGLSDTVNSGGDVGAAFDRIAPQIAAFEGVTPDHLGPLRAQLIQNPVVTINNLADAIHAANQEAVKNTPAGVIAQQKFDDQRAGQVQALGVTAERTAAVPAATDQARSLIPQMSSSAIIRKARAAIPGTAEYKFEQLVTQIKTNASLDDLRALRASGTSLGRVTNTEFTASANAFANLDLGQDPSTLTSNLVRLKSTYGVINDNLQADAKRLSTQRSGAGGGHVTGPQAAAPAAPASKQQFTKGAVYTDANGNKATWDGSKFVDVK